MCKNIRKKKHTKILGLTSIFPVGKSFICILWFISLSRDANTSKEKPQMPQVCYLFFRFFFFPFHTFYEKDTWKEFGEKKPRVTLITVYILPTYYFWHTCVFDVYCLRKNKEIRKQNKNYKQVNTQFFFCCTMEVLLPLLLVIHVLKMNFLTIMKWTIKFTSYRRFSHVNTITPVKVMYLLTLFWIEWFAYGFNLM